MEIVCSTDNNYVMPTGVMLSSLIQSNKGESINVHLLHGGISDGNIADLRRTVEEQGHNIRFYMIEDSMFGDFPIGRDYQNNVHVGLSLATYYRLFLARILPDDVDKVIYLDGDIIIVDSLRPLWDTDMTGKAVAAAADSYNNEIEHYNRLRYPQSRGYFNAGVMMINLGYWRENNLTEKFLKYVKEYPERLACHDQDVLNYLLRDVKKEIPLRYNMLNEYWFDVKHNVVSWEFEEQIKEGQRHPAVIHFTCIPKPWYTNCRHPYKKLFERYRSATLWADVKERRWLPLNFFLEKTCIKAVVMAGLRKPEYAVEKRYIKKLILQS